MRVCVGEGGVAIMPAYVCVRECIHDNTDKNDQQTHQPKTVKREGLPSAIHTRPMTQTNGASMRILKDLVS